MVDHNIFIGMLRDKLLKMYSMQNNYMEVNIGRRRYDSWYTVVYGMDLYIWICTCIYDMILYGPIK